MAGSSSKQPDLKHFTISQQHSGTKDYYLTASRTSSDVTLAEKAGPDFPETQLWSKDIKKDEGGSSNEAFFLFSKSKPKCALVEQKKDNKNRPLTPADNRITIGLRQTGTRWKMERREPKGTNTHSMENTQAAHKYFTISQQHPAGTKYLTAASSRDVTLEAKKADFADSQLWEKKEAFFLRSKSKPECALFEQLPPVIPANSQIELRLTPTMDGLWTKFDLKGKYSGLIYIQKASDPEHVLDAKIAEDNGLASVELEKKRKAGSSPKDTSRWKMEPWEPEAQAAIGASGSGSGPRSQGSKDKGPAKGSAIEGHNQARGGSISGS